MSKEKEAKPAKRRCKLESCNKEFTPPKDNPAQEYCSGECWSKSNRGL